MAYKQFEDIPVWQAGRGLVKAVYEATGREPFCYDWGLRDQIQRAAVSVTSNIAEGHERGSTADLIQFLYYAKGSAGEVRSQVYNAEDAGYLDAAQADALREQARDVGRQLYAWITSMQSVDFDPGPKYNREPPRRFDDWLKKQGMERLPNGRICKRQDP